MLPFISQLPPIRVPETLGAPPGVIDLWCFFYEQVEQPELMAAYAALMTPEERARHDRYYFERDRRLFLATRALVRTVLSCYHPAVAPVTWRFAEGERGKPPPPGPGSPARLAVKVSSSPAITRALPASLTGRPIGWPTV